MSNSIRNEPSVGTKPFTSRLCLKSGTTEESPWKVIKFRASLQGNKRHDNLSQDHPKSWKMNTGIMIFPTSVEVGFAIHIYQNVRFSNPRHPDSDPKIVRKSLLESTIKGIQKYSSNVPEKRSKWGPEIHHKSWQIAAWLQRAISCGPRRPRIVPRSPSTPNDKIGYHMPKVTSLGASGADGRGCSL